MSDKIGKKVADKSKQFPLTNAEFNFITELDAVGRSFEHYNQQLKNDYLQTIILRLGYKPEDNLELTIDLKSEDHILSVTKLPI